MVSLMQNEGKTYNRETMITFSLDDFGASGGSLEYVKVNNRKFWNYPVIFCLFRQFTTQLYSHAVLMFLNFGLI